jgi:signal transduction histidine kinase
MDRPSPAFFSGARAALLVVGASLFFAALFMAQNYVRDISFGPAPIPRFGLTLYVACCRWFLYGGLAVLVLRLVARWPIERGALVRRLALHAAAAAGFATVHCALLVVLFRLAHVYPRQDSMVEAFRRVMLTYFGMNYVVYVGIAGIGHAWAYAAELRRRELVAAELRAGLTQARLNALRAQLNPHFLFNTLNATSALALTGQMDQVVQTLSCLSDLLRVSLDRDLPQEVPLERELGILAAYLEIQRIRFGDRLAVDLFVDPDCTGALVPSMLLQPLLENAFEHGLARRPGPGRVTVRATRSGERLRLRVEDTGPGFVAEATNGSRQGIGLSNTAARLEQLYGPAAGLERGNLANGGAFVEVTLPLRAAPGAA